MNICCTIMDEKALGYVRRLLYGTRLDSQLSTARPPRPCSVSRDETQSTRDRRAVARGRDTHMRTCTSACHILISTSAQRHTAHPSLARHSLTFRSVHAHTSPARGAPIRVCDQCTIRHISSSIPIRLDASPRVVSYANLDSRHTVGGAHNNVSARCASHTYERRRGPAVA